MQSVDCGPKVCKPQANHTQHIETGDQCAFFLSVSSAFSKAVTNYLAYFSCEAASFYKQTQTLAIMQNSDCNTPALLSIFVDTYFKYLQAKGIFLRLTIPS